MGKGRRRINLSIDVDTYKELQLAQRTYGFRNTCEIVTSLVRVFVDRQRSKDMQVYETIYILSLYFKRKRPTHTQNKTQ